MTRNGLSRYYLLATVAFALYAWFVPHFADADDQVQCGPRSLYVLLKMYGIDASYDQIIRDLPRMDSGGYSIDDLITASSRSGCSLTSGILKNPTPPKIPFIAFLRRGYPGHYLVLKPLGASGSLMQVVDPPNEVLVVDFNELTSSRDWTGIILFKDNRNELKTYNIIIILIVISIFVLLLNLFKRLIINTYKKYKKV